MRRDPRPGFRLGSRAAGPTPWPARPWPDRPACQLCPSRRRLPRPSQISQPDIRLFPRRPRASTRSPRGRSNRPKFQRPSKPRRPARRSNLPRKMTIAFAYRRARCSATARWRLWAVGPRTGGSCSQQLRVAMTIRSCTSKSPRIAVSSRPLTASSRAYYQLPVVFGPQVGMRRTASSHD